MAESVTLKEVARLAGVSTATVARVIHGSGYVSEEARVRVKQAIDQTGYRINTVAQGLRTRRTMTIGHLLNSLVPNPFFATVALGVEREAVRRGYNVLMVDTQGKPDLERRGVEALIQRRVDAIVFTVALDADNVQRAVEAGVPVVQVENVTEVPSHQVVVDNWRGSFEATEHLISLGHRRIAYLGGRINPSVRRVKRSVEAERLNGYLDALKQHKLEVDQQLVVLDKYFIFDEKKDGFGAGADSVGYRNMQALLGLENPPTAVFAASDLLAAAALQAINAAKLGVPEDISVVGFDNTLAPFLSPPLTTVALPLLDIGRAAADIVLNHIEGGQAEKDELEVRSLTTWLLRRSSSAAVKN